MSEQPPRMVPATSAAAAVRLTLVLDGNDMLGSLRKVENVPGEQPAAAQGRAERGLGDFGLAHQEEVGVVSRQGIVERRLHWIIGPRWAHDPRRDDAGEAGRVLLIRPAAEPRAQRGAVAQPRRPPQT